MNTSFEFIEFLETFAAYALENPAWGRTYLRIAERVPADTLVPTWRLAQ